MNWNRQLKHTLAITLVWLVPLFVFAQTVSTAGCIKASFGVDAGLYSGKIEFGAADKTNQTSTNDWFVSAMGGRGIIDTNGTNTIKAQLQAAGNPQYEKRMNGQVRSRLNLGNQKSVILIDGLFARDHFGGTGGLDDTAYPVASKNGQDPIDWTGGTANVLGKNDLIDVGAHMFRDIDTSTNKNDLWFVGLINRAEPGGDAYMDFEFYVEEVGFDPATGFTSGGPDLGHTAFQFDSQGNITRIGDVIYNLQLTGGGTVPGVEVRIWVSRADYQTIVPKTFTWGAFFDGALQTSPYGYAVITPKSGGDICAYVNKDGELPAAPPWGTKNTKSHIYTTSYSAFSIVEMSLNMTAMGLDHISLSATGDYCEFPYHTFIAKTRASNSFTAQLKDFIGPFGWGQPGVVADTVGLGGTLSCLNLTDTLIALPERSDVTYQWSTEDGHIIGATNERQIVVDEPGNYLVQMLLPDGCTVSGVPATVSYDASKPFFNTPTASSTVSCTGSSGTIDLSVTGGTSPYSYAWTKDGTPIATTTQDLTALAPGTYKVTIMDAYLCQITSADITVPAKTPVNSGQVITNVACFGQKNGSITLSPTGGIAPLSYRWSNGKTTQNLTNVGAGAYTVTITDGVGCTTVETHTVTQPNLLALQLSKTDDSLISLTSADGTATASVSGGTPPYTYDWSKSGDNTFVDPNTATITGLSRATYRVTITDANGCTVSDSIRVWEPEICNDSEDNDGDGLNNCDDPDCQVANPGSISTTDASPCVDVAVTYSVPNVAGLTYTWNVPSNATIQSGQTTNSITVKWTTETPGPVCVYATRTGTTCTSGTVCYTATPTTIPSTPGAIQKTN